MAAPAAPAALPPHTFFVARPVYAFRDRLSDSADPVGALFIRSVLRGAVFSVVASDGARAWEGELTIDCAHKANEMASTSVLATCDEDPSPKVYLPNEADESTLITRTSSGPLTLAWLVGSELGLKPVMLHLSQLEKTTFYRPVANDADFALRKAARQAGNVGILMAEMTLSAATFNASVSALKASQEAAELRQKTIVEKV